MLYTFQSRELLFELLPNAQFTYQLTLYSFLDTSLLSLLTLCTQGFLSVFEECPSSLDFSHCFTCIWTNVIILLILCTEWLWEFAFKICIVFDHKFTGAMQIIRCRAAMTSRNTAAILYFDEQLVLSLSLPFAPFLPSVVLQFSANSDDLFPCSYY